MLCVHTPLVLNVYAGAIGGCGGVSCADDSAAGWRRGRRNEPQQREALLTKGAHESAVLTAAAVFPGLEPDYKLAGGLAGAGGLLTLGTPFGIGAPVGLPLGALAAFLATRTQKVRFVFDPDALEVMIDKGDGLSETAENFAVGGKNRWSYESIEEWACYPSLENPVLVYFRENQTRSSGQGHLFPVLFDAEQLRQLMAERVGEARLVTGPPRL